LGDEYGATTGRSRQVNWLDMDLLIKAINLNGVTDLVFNKIDVLENAGTLCFIYYGKPMWFENSDSFKLNIESIIKSKCYSVRNIIFSYSPHSI
jgi:adenylosuccinate synthase